MRKGGTEERGKGKTEACNKGRREGKERMEEWRGHEG